jgi:hypothetical protein
VALISNPGSLEQTARKVAINRQLDI